ncbi:CDP-alcohol phosphatidyltransferase family protein [Cellulophaga baltica]|uniref:CDP-alcohol phosphatidyltransferase family protein n=1 Tax=Cellulophaga TaxID=104264 RepID=UPI001C06BBF0|nr:MULTISPECIES: CDP-alcohol phosphatidyltransferase family protein [Cellulophaga]MBU2996556.1 CDP-alcohol phosphatidyltransferase family protein [Cellulophaga baltica]MDO6767950.1 CDP-alcohol phosphatidyltransferase family protein [Cellulophaga sp. 1_MG-2023]
MKKYIPNFITLLNLFCGCIAMVFAIHCVFEMVALFVFLGIVFDFFDGFSARILNVKSELGLQLDSMADMVTSGVVPGVVMFKLLEMSFSGGWSSDLHIENGSFLNGLEISSLIPLLGFVVTLGSGYRLAKFNIDENQTDSFVGLPTPANALLIISLPLILMYHNNDVLNGVILNQWFLLGTTFFSAFLLNCNLELFALKFKSWNFKDNAVRYIFILICLVLLATLKFLAVPAIIIFYIALSVFNSVSSKNP